MTRRMDQIQEPCSAGQRTVWGDQARTALSGPQRGIQVNRTWGRGAMVKMANVESLVLEKEGRSPPGTVAGIALADLWRETA